MTIIEIPGWEPLGIDHVVLDYNGTMTVDRLLLRGAGERISRFGKHVRVHVLIANTYGTVTRQCEPLGMEMRTFPREGVAGCKEEIVRGLESGAACLGNGFNDIQVFDAARLSTVAPEREGMCAALLDHAAMAVRSIEDELDLLLRSDQLWATLRSRCLKELRSKDRPEKNVHAGPWKCGFT